MSYILDALRRAEADRERSRQSVPGLSSQRAADPIESAERRLPLWSLGIGVAVLVAAAGGTGAWWAQSRHVAPPLPAPMGSDHPQDTIAEHGAQAPGMAKASGKVMRSNTLPLPTPAFVPQSTVATVVAPGPLPAQATPPSPSLRVPAGQPTPLTATVATPASSASAPASVAPRPANGLTESGQAQAPGSARASLQGSGAASRATHDDGVILTPPAPMPTLADLAPGLRRDLPKMSISGSVYSDDPASRFAIINGEVLHEGAHVSADLVLEQIRAHELVLRFKGQRFRQPI